MLVRYQCGCIVEIVCERRLISQRTFVRVMLFNGIGGSFYDTRGLVDDIGVLLQYGMVVVR